MPLLSRFFYKLKGPSFPMESTNNLLGKKCVLSPIRGSFGFANHPEYSYLQEISAFFPALACRAAR
jgi:hypothetical protein